MDEMTAMMKMRKVMMNPLHKKKRPVVWRASVILTAFSVAAASGDWSLPMMVTGLPGM
jgi:hypothetical protein